MLQAIRTVISNLHMREPKLEVVYYHGKALEQASPLDSKLVLTFPALDHPVCPVSLTELL